MSADSSVFSCLPIAERDSFLQQAFQQLDQRHLFGVAPRVCRLWHQLSLSIITSLTAKIATEQAAEQLTMWMAHHGHVLHSMQLCIWDSGCPGLAAHALLQTLIPAADLRSLDLSYGGYELIPSFGTTLEALTQLTSIRICGVFGCSLEQPILGLKELCSLAWPGRYFTGPFLEQLPNSLGQLTHLDFRENCVSAVQLTHLRKLAQLKQLALGHFSKPSELSWLVGLPITTVTIQFRNHEQQDVASFLQEAAGGLQELVLVTLGSMEATLLPLHQATQLRSLSLSEVWPGTAQVAALTTLTRLTLGGCGMNSNALESLTALSNLRELWLLDQPEEDAGLVSIMSALAASLPTLTALYLLDGFALVAARDAFKPRVVEDRKRENSTVYVLTLASSGD